MNTPKTIQGTFTNFWIQTHDLLMFMVSLNDEKWHWGFHLSANLDGSRDNILVKGAMWQIHYNKLSEQLGLIASGKAVSSREVVWDNLGECSEIWREIQFLWRRASECWNATCFWMMSMWKEVTWAVSSTTLNSFLFISLFSSQSLRDTLRDLTEYVKGLKGLFGSSRVMHNHIYWKQMNPITTHQSRVLLLLCGWKCSSLEDENLEGRRI